MSSASSPFALLSLKGKVALVTGATSGIGAKSAEILAFRGAKVVVSGRRRTAGEAVVATIKASGGDATFIQCDVAVEDDVKRLVEQTVATYGRLDVAFNNSGVSGFGTPHQTSTEQYDHHFGVNVRGMHFCIKYEAEQFLRQRKAAGIEGETSYGGADQINPNQLYLTSHPYAIINNGSVVGHKGSGLIYSYSATKFAVVGLTRSSALAYARYGIRVNAVAPGPTHSEMTEKIPNMSEFIAGVPMGRIAQAEEVAELVAFLASSAASYITGDSVLIDGGMHA